MLKEFSVKHDGRKYIVQFKEPAGELIGIWRLDTAQRMTGPATVRRTLVSHQWTPDEIRKAINKPAVDRVYALGKAARAKAQEGKT